MKKKATENIERMKAGLFENGSYKLVALFISLILWLTILGRREFVVIKDIEVEFSVAQKMVIAGQSTDKVRVKISGAQPLLKRYKETAQIIQINLSDRPVGQYEIEIPPSRIEAPNGIKILSVKPSQIRVEITAVKE